MPPLRRRHRPEPRTLHRGARLRSRRAGRRAGREDVDRHVPDLQQQGARYRLHSAPGEGALHHASFYLESWHDVGNAADIIARHNVALDIGPTQHGITRGCTIYFFDLSGNRNEVFSGGYQYYLDNPVLEWTEAELGKAIFYYDRKLNERFLSVTT